MAQPDGSMSPSRSPPKRRSPSPAPTHQNDVRTSCPMGTHNGPTAFAFHKSTSHHHRKVRENIILQPKHMTAEAPLLSTTLQTKLAVHPPRHHHQCHLPTLPAGPPQASSSLREVMATKPQKAWHLCNCASAICQKYHFSFPLLSDVVLQLVIPCLLLGAFTFSIFTFAFPFPFLIIHPTSTAAPSACHESLAPDVPIPLSPARLFVSQPLPLPRCLLLCQRKHCSTGVKR